MHCCSMLWRFGLAQQRPTAQSKDVERFDLLDMTTTGSRQPNSIMRNMLYRCSALTTLQHMSQQQKLLPSRQVKPAGGLN